MATEKHDDPELKNTSWPDAALITCDPRAVDEASRAGVGRKVSLTVGAKTNDLHRRPVEVKRRVKLVSDGTYTDPRQKNITRMGTTAVIRVDATDLILTSYMVMQTELAPFLSV